MASVESLKKDAAECNRLAELAGRENVRVFLRNEADRLKKLIDAEMKNSSALCHKRPETKIIVKIENYGWDQSDKFVKLYITLNRVNTLAPEQVISTFGVKSVEFQVSGLGNKNYTLNIKNLLHPIKPEESYHRVKTDMVCLFLKKETQQNWSHLTETEKKALDKKTPKMDVDDDPGLGIMNFMRQMYEDGDDEMKRTIAKAWTEARDRPNPDLY